MGFFERLFGRGDNSPGGSPTSPMEQMREAMDLARIARRGESYEQAYAALERAMTIADEEKDTHSVTVIALHQADILIDQGQYDAAEKLLQTVQQAAESVNQRGFTAYALNSLGNLQQARNELEKARATYEEARAIASRANAQGPEGRALGHLADLYLLEDNASYAVHLLEEALPKLNTAGDKDLMSYFVGRLGEARIAGGTGSDGRAMLERALQLAEQMRDKRMVRRWTIALGDSAYDADALQEAYLFYRRALNLLDEAGEPSTRAKILTRLSSISLQMSEPAEALGHAQAALALEEAQTPTERAVAQGALGMALRALGRSAEAVPYLEAAVESASGKVNALYIQSLRYLAASQLDAGDTASAAATYERTLKLAKEAGLPLPLGYIYRDYGLYHNRHNDLRAAIDMWTKALAIFQAEHEINQTARVLCDLANARRALGQTKRAMTDYENALVALNNVDDIATRGLVLANAANAYTDQGDTESSNAFFREAVEIAQKIGDRRSEATRLGNYGWFLVGTGEPRRAIERLTKALEISSEEGMTLHTAIQTDNLGLAYDALSQYRTAIGHHEQALVTLRTLDPVPVRWEATFLANTARTNVSLGLLDEAATIAEDALAKARTSGDFEAIVSALLALARVRLSRNLPNEAAPHIQEALSIAGRASLRRLVAEGYHLQSEQRAAVGDDEAAQTAWEQARKLYRMVGAPQTKLNPFWLEKSTPEENGG